MMKENVNYNTHEHSSLNPKDLAMSSLMMLTVEETALILGTTRQTVANLIECGLLKPTKIGKSQMLSQKELLRFQNEYAGMALSNKYEMLEAVKRQCGMV